MRTDRARLAPLGLVFLALSLAGCAVPLGPGYRLRHEDAVVHYQPAAATRLRIRTKAVVLNAGDRPLGSLRIRLPRRFPAGARVEASVAGRPVVAISKTVAGRTQVDVPLRPLLPKRQTVDFRLEYPIQVPSSEFILEAKDWFASFEPPHHLFARGHARAERTRVSFLLPAGYSALMGGRSQGVQHGRPGRETEYRYVTGERDLAPFLAVGKFHEWSMSADDQTVSFWTLEPIGAGCARTFADHLAATARLYRSTFGRLSKHPHPISVIEMPAGGGSQVRQIAGVFGSVPEGIVFSTTPAELCGQPERFFLPADQALAATWFGWAVRPGPDARGILGGGAQRYMTLVAEESREGGAAQARQVKVWIGEYDRLGSQTKPIAPVQLGVQAPSAQRRMAGIQSALCLVALQDRFGANVVRSGLAHLVRSLRDSTVGLDDLRSALEQEARHNLFDFFNEWLNRPGIPAAFLRRYGMPAPQRAYGQGSISSSRRAK